MGGYGAGYLGWQIRLSDNPDVIKTAQDMHPKLAAGMGIFFALGAVGGMMSMIMQVSKQRGRGRPGAVHAAFLDFSSCHLCDPCRARCSLALPVLTPCTHCSLHPMQRVPRPACELHS